MSRTAVRPVTSGVLALAIAIGLGPASARGGEPVDTGNPVMFVTQFPVPDDFATIGSTFASHEGIVSAAGRGGDLHIRYPDGTLRNLTAEAGYGNQGFQGANSISVRQPCVHWSGEQAVFSMVVGATTEQYQYETQYWQLYEVTGLGPGDTAVITPVPGQPQGFNNVSPIYAADGRIMFTSDRPRNGAAHLYPQLDEYESTPTNTGLWSLDPQSGELILLAHAPSGAFWPRLDGFGRVIFTKWDHLQRDQQADAEAMGEYAYGTFNYTSEAPDSADAGNADEVFPEPRGEWIDFIEDNPDYEGPLRGYQPHLVGHTIEIFQLWQINPDGTEEETLNHVGRHELQSYFTPSFNDDPSLVELIGDGLRIRNMFQVAEDPDTPGLFYAIDAPTFGTHACGQIVRLAGPPPANPDTMAIEYITHRDTASPSEDPSAEHSGLYRNPLPLANGLLIAAHTAETRVDDNEGSTALPQSRYDLRLKQIVADGSTWLAGPPLTGGIGKSVQFWSPDVLVSYDGPFWELDPVEVVARTPPPVPQPSLAAPELDAFAREGVGVEAVREFLRANDLALVVSRNVTTRDLADRQQPFNLAVIGSETQTTGDGGEVYGVGRMRFFQADQLRGIGLHEGRRVLAWPMHDDQGLNPSSPGGPGIVPLGEDGSMAALVPARRAMTWALTDDGDQTVVAERYWVTFQPGEIRTCTSCHGVNTYTQAMTPPPQNTPAALRTLLAHLRDEGHVPPGGVTGDVNGDGVVNVDDLVLVILAWGSADPGADVDGSGLVDVDDLVLVVLNWT